MTALEQNAFKELYEDEGFPRMPHGQLKADLAKNRIGEEAERRSERPRSRVHIWRRSHRTFSDDRFWDAETLTALSRIDKERTPFAISNSQEGAEFRAATLIESIHGSHRKYRKMAVRADPSSIVEVASSRQFAATVEFHRPPDLVSWDSLVYPGPIGSADADDSPDGSPLAKTVTSSVRSSGPVQFILKLLLTWKLETEQADVLLGLEDRNRAFRILNGSEPLVGRDIKDRIGHLYQVRRTLWSLFQDEIVENEWLREPHSLIHNMTPMDLLLEGSMESLLILREYVESLARK